MKNILNRLLVILLAVFLLASCERNEQKVQSAESVNAVTDLSHEFTFYADNRFHRQYLPGHTGVTNWCDLYNFNFENANLLILPGCDNRIDYFEEDISTIKKFLSDGGGVVILGSKNAESQNRMIEEFGASFKGDAKYPLHLLSSSELLVEGKNASLIEVRDQEKWDIIIADSENKPVMARRRLGKGTVLLSARSLAGSNPNASDSINKDLWKPLLKELAGGKEIDTNGEFKGSGIENLEYNDDHGTFKLSYNDYLKPFAESMVDVFKRSLPYIEARMGVPLSPGMASQVTLLSTGGGGFSSGTVVALAVWWGGFPEREDGMIEFLTHESVHSWVLPYPEVWNEPIATYVGNLVMIDMGYEEEGLKRIARTIERASKIDPEMKNYDLRGNLTGTGPELDAGQKNNIHWGKSYWIFEQLRSENPDFLAEYFKLKRQYSASEAISHYDINNTVAILSMAMGRDLFPWFNEIGIKTEKENAELKFSL